MKAIQVHPGTKGEADDMFIGDYEKPRPGPEELLVKVRIKNRELDINWEVFGAF